MTFTGAILHPLKTVAAVISLGSATQVDTTSPPSHAVTTTCGARPAACVAGAGPPCAETHCAFRPAREPSVRIRTLDSQRRVAPVHRSLLLPVLFHGLDPRIAEYLGLRKRAPAVAQYRYGPLRPDLVDIRAVDHGQQAVGAMVVEVMLRVAGMGCCFSPDLLFFDHLIFFGIDSAVHELLDGTPAARPDDLERLGKAGVFRPRYDRAECDFARAAHERDTTRLVISAVLNSLMKRLQVRYIDLRNIGAKTVLGKPRRRRDGLLVLTKRATQMRRADGLVDFYAAMTANTRIKSSAGCFPAPFVYRSRAASGRCCDSLASFQKHIAIRRMEGIGVHTRPGGSAERARCQRLPDAPPFTGAAE